MSERVIVLTSPIVTGDLDTVDYAHVQVERVMIDNTRKVMRWEIEYGNVVSGVFVIGAVIPTTYATSEMVREDTGYTALVTAVGTGLWSKQMRDVIYQYMLDNAVVAGVISTIV